MWGFFGRIGSLDGLARRYPATHQPQGDQLTKQTVRFGPVRFRRCVTVSIEPEGLYLWVRPIMSNYTPILIPWDEVKAIQEAIIYWQKAVQMSIGTPLVATVAVKMKLFRLIEPHLRVKD